MEIVDTPNPNAIKVVIDLSENEFSDELYKINGVTSVFYGPGFISITKNEEQDWSSIKADINKIFDKL